MKPVLELVGTAQRQRSLEVFPVQLTKTTSAWHYHPDIELTFVLRGEGIRQVGDHIGHFKAGDIMLTGENLPHDFLVKKKGEQADFLVVQFKKELVSQFPELIELSQLLDQAKRGVLFSHRNEVDDLPGNDHVEMILQNFGDKGPSEQWLDFFNVLNQLSRRSVRTTLCSELFSSHLLGDIHLTRINQIIEFVNNHYTRSIELKEVAELVSMTVPSFCRWFKRTMNVSFVTYLNQCRVEYSARLLLSTHMQISKVAADSGFDSISSFNRAFKKVKGASPSVYRRNY
jgi:AraC-like DNA-binding protein/mannose-6-phosphate isomerase-like protein (cupin superfamily)